MDRAVGRKRWGESRWGEREVGRERGGEREVGESWRSAYSCKDGSALNGLVIRAGADELILRGLQRRIDWVGVAEQDPICGLHSAVLSILTETIIIVLVLQSQIIDECVDRCSGDGFAGGLRPRLDCGISRAEQSRKSERQRERERDSRCAIRPREPQRGFARHA